MNHYNCLYDKGQYTTITTMLATDLRAERESIRVSDAVNLITNMMNGRPHYELVCLKLATF